jgi:phage terminase large subunit-like protein
VTAAVKLMGCQQPRIMTGPSFESSPGKEAIDLAAMAGLHLYPWQKLVLTESLGENGEGDDRKWAAFEVGLIVPRQNGKGSCLEARELFGLFLEPRERLILHSAHEFKTASEAFLRVKQCIDSSDWLTRKVKNIRTSHGEEGIELIDGSRLRFVARSTGSGRGFTGDCLILDEAYNLGSGEMAALLPTLSARPNPQVWYTSSAGMITSEQLRQVRIRGRRGDSGRLAYYEWSCPEDADLDDPQNWAQANPTMGYRIDESFVAAERLALPDDVFARERLGIWQEDNVQTVIDLKLWATITDPDSRPGESLVFSIDIKPDSSAACISSAGRRTDGRMHVKVVDHRPGIGWIIERIAQLVERYKPVAVVLDPSGPAGSLLGDLAELEIEPKLVSAREMAQACGAFHNDVINDRLRHTGQETLTSALRQAKTRPLGDAWAWSRRDSRGDISPLVAATLSTHGFRLFGGLEATTPWVMFD